MKSWFQRSLFILFLGGLLFLSERYLHPKRSPSMEKKENRMLVLGGSVAFNIESSIRRFLAHEKVMDTSVHSFVGTGLSSEYALKMLPDLLGEFHPKHVFVLLGMNEDPHDGNPDDNEEADGLEREKKLRELLKLREAVPFAQELKKSISYDLSKGLCSRIFDFGVILMINDTEHFHDMDLKPALEMLRGELSSRPLAPRECQMAVLKIATFLRYHDEPIFGVDFRSDFLGHDERKDARKRFLSFFRRFYEEGFHSIAEKGESHFSEKGPANEYFDRYWLTLVYNNVLNRSLTFQDFIQYSSDMSPYRYIITKLHSIRESEDEEGKIFDQVIETWPGKQYDLVAMNFPESFKENLRKMKSLIEGQGGTLWILQYPNLRLESLQRIGEELGVKVLDGKLAFEGKVTQENYYQYFIDKRSGSGHMTELGALLYGKSLMDQSGIFKK